MHLFHVLEHSKHIHFFWLWVILEPQNRTFGVISCLPPPSWSLYTRGGHLDQPGSRWYHVFSRSRKFLPYFLGHGPNHRDGMYCKIMSWSQPHLSKEIPPPGVIQSQSCIVRQNSSPSITSVMQCDAESQPQSNPSHAVWCKIPVPV